MNNELKKMRRYYKSQEVYTRKPKPKYRADEKAQIGSQVEAFLKENNWKSIPGKVNTADLMKKHSNSFNVLKFGLITIVGVILMICLAFAGGGSIFGLLFILLPVAIMISFSDVKPYVYPYLVEINGEASRAEQRIAHGVAVTEYISKIEVNRTYFDISLLHLFNKDPKESVISEGFLVVTFWNNSEIRKNDLLFYPVKIESQTN